MRPGVPADLQSAVLRVSGFIIRNTPILYIVRIENPDAQSNRITNPIEQRTDLCRYSPQKFKSKIKSDTVSFGQEVETICRIYKNKANEAGQALCQIIGNIDRHAAKRVFQRSSDYATFRLSRHHGDGTFHSHDSYSPTPSGRQAAEYRHSQSTYLCAGPRILWKVQRLSACQIN